MLLSSVSFRKLTDFLLLNAYSLNNMGLLNGKAGIAVTLFEVSRYLKDNRLEEHACEILQTSLVARTGYSFANGKAGIGYGLWYLLQHQFVEGEYEELFGEQHTSVVQHVLSSDFKGDEKECVRLFYFLNRVQLIGIARQQEEALSKLANCMYLYYQSVFQSEVEDYEKFLNISANIIPVMSYSTQEKEWFKLKDVFLEAVERWRRNKIISNNLWYARELYRLAKQCNLTDFMEDAWQDLHTLMRNVNPLVMTLRQLADSLLCFSEMMRSEFEQKLQGGMGKNKDLNEDFLTNAIGHSAYYVGLEKGVGRLLLAEMGYCDVSAQSRMTEIFRLTF